MPPANSPLADHSIIPASTHFEAQIQANTAALEYFHKRIQAAHFQTPSTSPEILHWNSKTGDLSTWKWPVELGTGRRVPPSDLEDHRRTHQFRAPSCLCAYLDRKHYTESSIGVVHVPMKLARASSLNGEYTAECATGRCGYLVCLEKFYILPVLPMRGYSKRDTPRPPTLLTHNSTIDFLKGLQQVLPSSNAYGRGTKRPRVEEPDDGAPALGKVTDLIKEGISEGAFYMLFIQCFLCQAVVLRSCFPHNHHCLKKLKYQEAELGIYMAAQKGHVEEGDPTDIDTDSGIEEIDDLITGLE
ncbi:hypothetical protein BKA70DRAFT_1445251 [Coprinopsis sp. MPI-PUGE-AT-0042]|nr:hypothetical protein BKA70DRAFT_1445251 [Coprinopsis sp. MPI-PUGE-AT-0042]